MARSVLTAGFFASNSLLAVKRSPVEKSAVKKWGLVSLLLMLASLPFSTSYAQENAIENPAPSVPVQESMQDAMHDSEQEPAEQNAENSPAKSQQSESQEPQANQAEAQTSSAAPVTAFYEKSAAQTTAPAAPSTVGSVGHLLNTVIGLVLIIALIFGLSFFVKRFGAGGFTGNNQLKVLSSMPLGTRERIVLIDAAGQQILLGITPTNINTLHVFAEPVVVSNENATPADFGKTLMSLLQSKKAARSGNNNSGNNDNNSSVV
jgi:flagellar protein FliO/FliZ